MLQGGVTPVPYLSRRMTSRATMLQGGGLCRKLSYDFT